MGLIELLQPLKESPDPAKSFHEHLFHKYLHKFNTELKKISQLTDDEFRVTALQDLLVANRRLISGTLLDYTASVYHHITQRCINIAKFLAQSINQDVTSQRIVSPIELLYPNFNFLTDSTHHWQLGAEIYEKISVDEQQRHAAFCRTELDDYIDIGQELKALEQQQAQNQSLTQEDEHRLNHLHKKLFSIQKKDSYKNYTQVERKSKHNLRLKRLVEQGSHIEVANRGVIPNIEVQDILASHILSSDHTHLIPVKELAQEQSRHVYDDLHDLITEDERMRMERFNQITRLYTNARAEYLQLINHKNHLLGHLILLHDLLKFNDAHSGIGQVLQTGFGSYTALIQFQNYYEQLPAEAIALIPEAVSKHIANMFKVASEHGYGETCTGLMRKNLAKIINAHQTTLIKIGTSDEQKTLILQRIKLQLDVMRSQSTWISSADDDLSGDELGVSSTLLHALEIKVTIRSLQDWNGFMSLPEDAIVALIANQSELRRDLITKLSSLSEWLSFFQNYSLDKIKLFFNLTREYEAYYFNNDDAESWAELLVQLPTEKFQIVVESFASTCLSHINNLTNLLECLAADQQKLLISVLLKVSLQNCTQLYNLLSLSDIQINLEQRVKIWSAMQSKFGDIITDGIDLYRLFSLSDNKLNSEQKAKIFSVVQSQLGTIINNYGFFYKFMSLPITKLNLEQRDLILSSLQSKFDTMITDGTQLYDLFRLSLNQLNAEQRVIIWSSIQSKLSDIIQDGELLYKIFSLSDVQLIPYQRDHMLSSLKISLGTIITDGDALYKFFRLSDTQLSSAQRLQIWPSVQSQLEAMISNGSQLCSLLKLSDTHLNAEQRSKILSVVQNKFGSLIKDSNEFYDLLNLPCAKFNAEQRELLCSSMQSRFGTMIKYSSQIYALFCLSDTQLNSEQRVKIWSAIQINLGAIIIDGCHLFDFLRLSETELGSEQRSQIFASIAGRLGTIIKNGDEVSSLFSLSYTQLNLEQRTKIWSEIQSHLGTIIKDGYQLYKILLLPDNLLSQEQRSQLVSSPKIKFGNIIKVSMQIFNLFTLPDNQLNAANKTKILLAVKSKLRFIFKIKDDINILFGLPEAYINSEHKNIILSAISAEVREDLIKISNNNLAFFKDEFKNITEVHTYIPQH